MPERQQRRSSQEQQAQQPLAAQLVAAQPAQPAQNRGGQDPGRVGNGVLQPVLTWGPSCAPKLPPDPYSSGWWISGQYVNIGSSITGPGGCAGGDYLNGAVGDYIEIDMLLKDGKWVQTMKDVMSGKTVDYTVDLKGQEQNDAMWLIETPGV